MSMDNQISLFDFLPIPEEPKYDNPKAVGDLIGRIVLGECRVARIEKVEGNGRFMFYRTDSGSCYDYKDGLNDIEELVKEAIEARKQYKTIEPKDLQECITLEYTVEQTGKKQWKQVGIFKGMLFWKDWSTYQFLEPYKTQKELRKAYEKFKKEMLADIDRYPVVEVKEQEHPMRRLYWSRKGFYADAEYVKWNG